MTESKLSVWGYIGYTALFIGSMAVAFFAFLYQIMTWLARH